MKNFLHRSLFGGIFILAATLFIYFSQETFGAYAYALALFGIIATALYEYSLLCVKKQIQSPFPFLLLTSFIYYGSTFFEIRNGFSASTSKIFLLLSVFFLLPTYFKNGSKDALVRLPSVVFGFVFITFPLTLLLNITFIPVIFENIHTSFWLVLLLCVTKGSDVFAYIGGKFYGKHKLCKQISPNKTMEGALTGVLSGGIIAAIIPLFYGSLYVKLLPLYSWPILGILLSLAGILGDLHESFLKRDAEVKDSNAIPGLGGILDMVDSLTFTAPLLYLLLYMNGILD